MSRKDRYCCNPLGLPHKKKISSSCRKMTLTTKEELKLLTGREYQVDTNILCPSCRKEIKTKISDLQLSIQISDDELEIEDANTAINTSTNAFGLSPLKFSKVSKMDMTLQKRTK